MGKLAYLKSEYDIKGIEGVLAAVAFRFFINNPLNVAKDKVSKHIRDLYDNRVAYGVFEGMQLSEDVWWGKHDVAAKVLGVYEASVLRQIAASAKTSNVFVDIGAADGYFAVGALYAGLFDRSVAFELSDRGRALLAANAANNGVSDKLEIKGAADPTELLSCLMPGDKAVVLCDIEGAEFGLFDETVLSQLAGRTTAIIIETHPTFVTDGQEALRTLIARAEKHFTVKHILSDDPKLNQFSELDSFSDDERLLTFSEGRPEKGHWLLLL